MRPEGEGNMRLEGKRDMREKEEKIVEKTITHPNTNWSKKGAKLGNEIET